ncbi:hypothetical protein K0M31_001466 [Melipona bicolor]|uniref:Uncharacterized protein n=1 Tax=Melipona bicolor TaxID=60889 RepID=A0AA40GFT4_9HYME|nr:hypothetical protein K0M31_001466 [Melipona bicolor]
MGGIVGLLLCIVLCASVGGVQGACRREFENNDMIEYLCTGGQLSDLDDIPTNIEKIRISEMPIGRITADTFSRFGPDLLILGCSHCGVTDIDPDAFQHLNNLQQLSLNDNRLTTVKKSWFKGLNSLTYLDINYNKIESIEAGVFENLPSLNDLRLSGNRLECLNLASMSHLKELKRIFLTENPEFKCPNAVSAFLESRGVSFEKDPDWNRFPTDLISAEVSSYDYDIYYEEGTTEEPFTSLPVFRERLHLTTTPSPTVASTVSYVSPKFHTTEEVIYHPYNTPDWRTTPEAIAVPYYNGPKTTTPSYDENQYIRTPYTPPKTIAPIEYEKYPQRETIQYGSQDVTTLSSWPRTSESASASNEYPVYQPHRNEDKHYTEQPDYSRLPNSHLLAPGQDYHQTMPPYVHFDTRMNPYNRIDGSETNTVPSNVEYPPVSVPSVEDKEYLVSSVDSSDTTHSIQPIPRMSTAMIQPAHPDNIYQPPYYEPTITVHSPPLISNQPQQETATSGIGPIETTTDKPLPNCPIRNLSSSNHGSVAMIIVSFVLAVRVLVEGF